MGSMDFYGKFVEKKIMNLLKQAFILPQKATSKWFH